MTSLNTERLLLRPLELSDAPRIAALSQDWDVARMLSSIPFPQPAISVEGFLLIEQARRPLGKDTVFAFTLPGDGLIGLGGVHLRGADYQGRNVEIGYWTGRPYWGRGLATEAAGALAEYAAALAQGPVVAHHFADNPASGRVLAKNGFAYTGESQMRFSLARGQAALALDMVRQAGAQVKAA